MPIQPPQLHKLKPAERERLQEQLKKNGGRLLFLVHPFFHQTPKGKFLRTGGEQTQKEIATYLKVLERFAHSARIPIVVFEEKHLMKWSHEKLKKLAPQREWVFIPSKRGEGTPILRPRAPRGENETKNQWKPVIEELKKVGAQRIFLSGQRYFEPGCACVGASHEALTEYGQFKLVKVLPRGVVKGLEPIPEHLKRWNG